MRRILLILLAALMLSPAAEANPLTLLRALGKLGSGASKLAKAGKAASLAKGVKGAASAGAVAKASKVAVGASAGALAVDAARGLTLLGDDAARTALFIGGGESGALSVITRAGEQAVTSPMALGAVLDDAARLGGKPLDLLLDPAAAFRVQPGQLPPDARLFVLGADDVVHPVTLVDDGAGSLRAVVEDSLEPAWELGQFVLDLSLADDGWPAPTPLVVAVTDGPCAIALAERAPELGRCDAVSVRDWLEQDIERAVVLLLQAEQDPAPFVAVAHAQGHDLAALSFSTLDELTLVVANGLLKAEGPRHAPLLKVAPLQSSEFSPGSPAVLRGRFVPDPVALPTLQSGVWVVHLPEEEAVEDAELDGAADVEPPLWIYVLGLALSIPVIVLMKAKGKL